LIGIISLEFRTVEYITANNELEGWQCCIRYVGIFSWLFDELKVRL